jgi:hypothetical protein
MEDIQHAFEDAKLKEMYSKAVANISMARERNGRSEANVGLFEERLSEITRNRALATKDKMAALAQLVETIQKFGELETSMQLNGLNNYDFQQEQKEDVERADARNIAINNELESSITAMEQEPIHESGENQQMQQQPQGQPMQQPQM